MQAVTSSAHMSGAAAILNRDGIWLLVVNAARLNSVILSVLTARLIGAAGWTWDDLTITAGARNPAGEHALLDRLALILGGLDQAEQDEITGRLLCGLRVDIDPGGPRDVGSAPPVTSAAAAAAR